MNSQSIFAALAATLVVNLSAQGTDRINRIQDAPRPGANLNLVIRHPTTEAGNPFAMCWSLHTKAVTNLALSYVQGALRLNPLTFLPLYAGTFNATGSNVTTLPIPNDLSLLGGEFDVQSVDLNFGTGTFYLADNDVTPHIVSSIGTTVTLEGTSPSQLTGDFVFQKNSNSNMGTPGNQAATGSSAFGIIRHVGQKGYVEGFAGNFTATTGNSDIHLWRRDRVTRNSVNGVMQTVSLPNGFDLAILRDKVNCKKFSLVSIERATGTATILTGSTVTDVGTYLCTAPTTAQQMYRQQFAFTDDGEIAVCIVHDSTTTPTPNVGPPDRVFLVKTNPTKVWAANNQNVLDVSPVAAQAMHYYYDGNLRVCNEMFFAEGEDPAGVTGEAVLYAGPLDGSVPMTKVTVPKTGTNLPFYWSFNNWRVSQDGKTMVFPIGGNSASSTSDRDFIAVTNISKAGPMVVKNITNFPTSTLVTIPNGANLGSIGPSQIKASLTPNGTWLAFTTGAGTAAAPDSIYITKTDGTTTPTLITTGTVFAAAHLFYGSVEFLSNTNFIFLGGAASTFCDWYACDITNPLAPVVTKLTNTAAQNTQPFAVGGNVYNRGHFFSRSRRFLYFIRGYGSSLTLINNLVAIDSQTMTLKDITGTEFSAGTAPALYRGPSTTALSYTVNPWPALEWQIRSSPVGNDAFFVAELGQGVSTTAFNDCNVFRFDMENAGQAVKLTNNTGTGAQTAVKGINGLVVAPNGQWVAYAERVQATGASEDVFVIPAAGGTPLQLSATNFVNGGATAGQTIVDGSIVFTGSPVDGVAWSIGTGAIGTPIANSAAQWSRVTGQGQPFLLTPYPTAAPSKLFMVLVANPANQ